MPSYRIHLPEEIIELHPVGEQVILLLTDESDSESDDWLMNDPQMMPASVSESSEDSSNDENPVSEGEVNAAVGLVVRQPYRNTAIRSRGRGLGQGRGQNGQLPRNEFLVGRTFNGFAQNLEPEEIIDHRIDISGEMIFRVRWINHQGIRLIESSVMRQFRPDMVMDYLQAVVARLPENDLNSVD